jgi:beta-phosphoglucomutase family hydrolase
MRQAKDDSVISRDRYDAVLFDLDGVITNTASIHAACWKQMFDGYLEKREVQTGQTLPRFDVIADYRLYVDGKPRFDGVRDFLKSRSIHIPEGSPHDPPEAETVCGLGNRKNRLVIKAIEEESVEAYEGSVRFVQELRAHGYKVAIVSSSENCKAVLKAAKVDDLFEVRVDGAMVEAQHLAGKPAPDTFLIAAKLLGVEPQRSIVVEDALSGVEAGLAGKFGLVVGVARKDNADALRQHGAHVVVNDLSELLD